MCFLSACTNDKTKKEPLDTKHVKLNYRAIRYDQEFFKIDTNSIYENLDALGKKYPDFTNLYLTTLAGFGDAGSRGVNTNFDKAIRQFLTLKDYRNLYDTVQAHFPDTKSLDKELESTFKNIKYYYPSENLGRVYYFMSGLNLWSAITIDSAIGIGLDMYLGKDFPFYSSVQIPAYEVANRVPERVSVEVAKAIFDAKYPFEYEGKSLLEMILYKGKELYFVEQVCRDKSEDKIIGYTPEQASFCNEAEESIYYFFMKRDVLYSTTWQDIMPYINDGPNTPGMPMESPGNIGSWLGWQIVKKYAAEHPNEGLVQLLENKLPAQQFLRAAKYKP